jgi:dTDP-4-amino-4,6-dideoxygalactose transaminase
VDIDPRTYNLAPDKLDQAIRAIQQNDSSLYPIPRGTDKIKTDNKSLITDNTLTPKAIIPVDLFGLPADYERINAIAVKHGLWIIEDAAQSLGGNYNGCMAGTLGHIGCTSFFPAKPLGCYGDGGAVFTEDDNLAHELRSIRVHGKGTHKYDNARIGINGRLDTMQAAVLLAKLDIFPREIELRQQIAQRYTEKLEHSTSDIRPPYVPPGRNSAWAQYSLLAKDGGHRQALQDRLKQEGIPTVVYYPKPLHQQSAFDYLGYQSGDMPAGEDCAQRIFSLPMHPYLSFDAQDRICEVIKDKAKNSWQD